MEITENGAIEKAVRFLATTPVMTPIDEVTTHPDNPRRGNIQRIKESILARGFLQSIVVQASTNYIVIGNHRYMALRELGVQEIPVALVDIDDDEAIEMMIADNRLSDLATNDEQLTFDLIDAAYQRDPASLARFAYTTAEFDALATRLDISIDLDEPLEADDVPPEAVTVFEIRVTTDTIDARDEVIRYLETEGYEYTTRVKRVA